MVFMMTRQVESGAMVAAGAVVPPNSTVPNGELWAGSPAKYLRSLKPEETEFILPSAQKYVELAHAHRQEHQNTALPGPK